MSNRATSILSKLAWLTAFYSITVGIIYLALTTNYKANDDLTVLRLAVFLLLLPIIFKYLIQLLTLPFYSPLEYFRKKKFQSQLGKRVSVLIPAWNEEVGIINTIQSVIETNYSNLEIIVINDGSTDKTHSLVSEYIENFKNSSACNSGGKPMTWASAKQQNISLEYLNLSNGGKARALNRGLRVATGEFVVTIDADSLMDKRAIEKMIERFADPKVGAVAGNVVIGNKEKSIGILQQLEYLYGFFFKRADSVFSSVYIIGGAAAAYRKSVLSKVGGFDHQIITEDIEMSTRILGAGYKTRFAADGVVYTEGPSDWKGLCNQRLRWKFGRLLTFIKHKSLFFSARARHNPYLTYLLLPMAVYAEFTLLFEGLLLSIFYGYSFLTNDYVPLVFVIGFITLLVSLQIVVDSKRKHHANLLVLAPIAWVLFYVIDLVEWQALCRSLKRLAMRQQLQWQKWVRVGL